MQALHATNGQWDLLAELQVESLPELAHALERIRLTKGISHSETSIHLESLRAAPSAQANMPAAPQSHVAHK